MSLFEGDGSVAETPAARGGLARTRVRPRAALRAVPRARGQPAARVPDGHEFVELSGLAGHRVHAQARHVDAGAGRAPRVRAAPAAQDRGHRPELLRTDSGRRPAALCATSSATSSRAARRHPRRSRRRASRASRGITRIPITCRRRGSIAELIEPFARSFARHIGPIHPAVLAAGGPEGDQRRRVRRAAGRLSGAVAARVPLRGRDSRQVGAQRRIPRRAREARRGARLQLLVGDADAGRAGQDDSPRSSSRS